MFKKVLIIAPHCDDEMYGMGGTILKMIDDGVQVNCMIGSVGDVNFEHNGMVKRDTRIEEFESIAKSMGFKGFIAKSGFDKESKLDSIDIVDMVTEIDVLLNTIQPDTVFVAGPSFHQDHEVVYKAAIAALRPTRAFYVKNVILFENPTYMWNLDWRKFNPNMYLEINIERKVEEFKRCYCSQERENEMNMLSIGKIKDWARYRGMECNVGYAEAFTIVRHIG